MLLLSPLGVLPGASSTYLEASTTANARTCCGHITRVCAPTMRMHPQVRNPARDTHHAAAEIQAWYTPHTMGTRPSPRSGHTATLYDDNILVIVAGWDAPVCYNDVYLLDMGVHDTGERHCAKVCANPRVLLRQVCLTTPRPRRRAKHHRLEGMHIHFITAVHFMSILHFVSLPSTPIAGMRL